MAEIAAWYSGTKQPELVLAICLNSPCDRFWSGAKRYFSSGLQKELNNAAISVQEIHTIV